MISRSARCECIIEGLHLQAPHILSLTSYHRHQLCLCALYVVLMGKYADKTNFFLSV